MIIRNAAVSPSGVRDLHLGGPDGEVDVEGCVVVPGIVDDHVHLMSTAAAAASADLSAARSVEGAIGIIMATGAHRAVALDVDLAASVDRQVLDRIPWPVRVQDRTGTSWTFNSLGATEVGLSPGGDGRLYRGDRQARLPGPPPDLAGVGAQLAARGVTAVTDATATNGLEELGALAAARLPQRVTAMTAAAEITAPAGIELGSVKIVLDDADLPPLDDLESAVGAAHAAGRSVAVHCVTASQLAIALAAGLGRGDRLEHASVIPNDFVGVVAASGVTVVTQPGLVWSRGDRYLEQVDVGDRSGLYRLRSLQDAGVEVRGSSDAPFGPIDPWRGIAAAADRRTRDGVCLGADERLGLAAAIDLFARAQHDLCILDRTWGGLAADPAAAVVVATLAGGRLIHGALPAE